MKMKTLRECFDIAKAKMIEQEWEQSLKREYAPACAFRGLGNLSCAIGAFIPDEKYEEFLESADAICDLKKNKSNSNNKLLISILQEAGILIENNLEFFADLQNAHDKGNYPEKMKQNFDNLEKKWFK